MNPFEQPPAGAPVSFEPPEPPASGPSRRRMAVVAIITAGLIGGGIAGVSQLASADPPDLAASATEEPDGTVPPVDDEVTTDEETGDEPADDTPEPSVETDGQIVVETGDDDPFVIDLGEIAEVDVGRLMECMGLPEFDGEFGLDLDDLESGGWESGDLPIGDLGDFFDDLLFDLEQFDWESGSPGEFGAFDVDGGSVTVSGPDGVSVVDLGENGSVTITKQDGDVSIATDGDATVSELDDLFGDFGEVFGGDFDFGDFEFGEFDLDDAGIDEFLESLPNLDELELPAMDDLQDLDPAEIQSCLDDVLGR